MISTTREAFFSRSTRWLPLLITLIILWLATGLRFYQLGDQSFWNDEGNSARLSERSLPLIIEGTASDIHPPLYYLLLRGWREMLGESEFGLRSFSAFAGILTIAASLALARLLFRQRNHLRWVVFLALLCAFLAAVNPALVYYSRETRMYALLALLSAVSTVALLRWLDAEWRWPWAVLYVVTATAGLYTHYFFPAVLVLHNLIVILWSFRYIVEVLFAPLQFENQISLRKTLLNWVGMMILIFLLYLPWLPVFLGQVGGRPGQREPFITFLWEAVRWLSFGETIAADDLIWSTVAVIILVIWTVISERGKSFIALMGFIVPLLFMVVAGTTLPAFYKFMLTAIPFFAIFLGGGVGGSRWLKKSKWILILPIVGLLLLLWGTAVSLNNLYNDPTFAKADYRGIAARIAAEDHANAGIILNAPNQWEVFTYYHRHGAPVYPLPKGQPDPAILEPQLAEIAMQHERLYALFWGENQRDPQRVVESWLDKNTFKASEEWVGDVRFVVYAVPAEAAQEMETAVNLLFGDHISLLGYAINSNHLEAGDIAQITLFWETSEPIDKRYKVFVHLLDEHGNLVAQHDGEPGGGQSITTEWQPGERIIDNHGLFLPADLPPGTYRVLVGLYDSIDPTARLPLSPAGIIQEYGELGRITVE